MRARPWIGGLVVGFTLGWLVFGTEESSPPAPPAPPEVVARSGDRDVRPDVAGNASPPAVDVVAALRSGAVKKIQSLLQAPGRTWTAAEVDALIEWVDRSRAEGQTDAFRAALHWLAVAKTTAAQEKLLALMADETLNPPFRLGDAFLVGLHDSDLSGVAAAARKRFEFNVASGETSWVAGHGYFELVAATGTADDIAWLAARAEFGVARVQAREALAASENPDAIALSLRLIEDRKADQEFLIRFAMEHPEIGADLLRRVILGEVSASYRELSAVLRAYGACVPEDAASEARSLLVSLREPMPSVMAVYAVESMRRRGLSVDGLEAVVAAPAEFLELAMPDTNRAVASKARYAIESNRVAWSSRAAAALEHAAEVLPKSSMTMDMVKIANQIRAGLAGHWK